MASTKACKACKFLYTGAKCPQCGSQDSSDNSKGRVVVLHPDESEIAQRLKITHKGKFAIRT